MTPLHDRGVESERILYARLRQTGRTVREFEDRYDNVDAQVAGLGWIDVKSVNPNVSINEQVLRNHNDHNERHPEDPIHVVYMYDGHVYLIDAQEMKTLPDRFPARPGSPKGSNTPWHCIPPWIGTILVPADGA
jgi:hypothetical protein